MNRVTLARLLFWLEYYLYFIVHTLDTTAFAEFVPDVVFTIVRFFVFASTIVIVIANGSLSKRLILPLICVLAGILNYYVTGFAIPLELFCLTISASRVDFRKVLQHYLYIVVSIMILAFFASSIGVISTNDVVQNGMVRYAFGATYATDFAAHIFYLILVDNYLNFKRTSLWRCLIYLALALFIWINCVARLDIILIILLVILDIYLMINTKVKNIDISEYKGSKIIRALLVSNFIISAIVSFYAALHYNDNAFMQAVNLLSSNRLRLANQGIQLYGYPLFGHLFDMVGSAALSRSNGMGLTYFFIDNSYVYIMLRYGVLTLIGLILSFTVFINDRINKKDSILAIFLALISLSSIVDHHLLSVYNPFILAMGAYITEWKFTDDKKFIAIRHGKLFFKHH